MWLFFIFSSVVSKNQKLKNELGCYILLSLLKRELVRNTQLKLFHMTHLQTLRLFIGKSMWLSVIYLFFFYYKFCKWYHDKYRKSIGILCKYHDMYQYKINVNGMHPWVGQTLIPRTVTRITDNYSIKITDKIIYIIK